MLSETINDQIKIIDDESSIAQFDDHYRATRLLASLAKENHPIRQFSWGDKFL
jgi:secreted Zn-dependent insulinase-like peptidase